MFAVSRHTLEMDALRRTHDVRAAELSEQVTQLRVRPLLHVPYVGSYTPGQPGIILQVFLQALYLASHYIDVVFPFLFWAASHIKCKEAWQLWHLHSKQSSSVARAKKPTHSMRLCM